MVLLIKFFSKGKIISYVKQLITLHTERTLQTKQKY